MAFKANYMRTSSSVYTFIS